MVILELVDLQKLVDFFFLLLSVFKNEVRQIEKLIHQPILISLKMPGLEQLHLLSGWYNKLASWKEVE